MSETSLSLFLPSKIGGGTGGGTVTGASNGLALNGSIVELGGLLQSALTVIDGDSYTKSVAFRNMSLASLSARQIALECGLSFTLSNFLTGVELIVHDGNLGSLAFHGAPPDTTPMKWQGGSSDGRQSVVDESGFQFLGGFDYLDEWNNQPIVGTKVIVDFTPSNVFSNNYMIQLPESSTCEGRELKLFYNNLQQANVTLFDGVYTNGIVVRDYLSRGIDFTQQRDNFWILKSMQYDFGVFKWVVISNMRTF